MGIAETSLRWLKHQRWPLALMALCIGLFWAEPTLDLITSRWFFDGNGFPWDTNTVVQLIYRVFAKIHLAFLVALPVLAVREHLRRGSDPRAIPRRMRYAFLWLTLLIGPGVITHVGLKDNSFGRPRPRDVSEFLGEKPYAAPFEISQACPKNCSFVSGHAAIGFWFLTLGWVYGRRRWMVAGFTVGLVVGATRLIQGAHFLSDVVFAFWVVWFTNALLAPWFDLPSNALLASDRSTDRPA